MKNHLIKTTAILIFSSIVLGFMFAHPLWSNGKDSEFSLKVTVPTQEVYIGDEVKVKLTYSRDEFLKGTFEVESPSFPGFEINDVIPGVEKKENKKIVRTDIYKLTPATAGTWEIEFPGIEYISKDGKKKSYKPESKTIVVKDLPEWMIDQIDIKDIKKPHSLNLKSKRSHLIYYLIFLFLVVLALYYIFRKKKSDESDDMEEEMEPEIDGFEEFNDNMTKLLALNLIRENRYKEFIERLSYIFRLYISRKFKIPATELTSEELLYLTGSKLKLGSVESRMIHLFDECDLIKFAKSAPEKYEIDDLTNETRAIVENIERGEKN